MPLPRSLARRRACPSTRRSARDRPRSLVGRLAWRIAGRCGGDVGRRERVQRRASADQIRWPGFAPSVGLGAIELCLRDGSAAMRADVKRSLATIGLDVRRGTRLSALAVGDRGGRFEIDDLLHHASPTARCFTSSRSGSTRPRGRDARHKPPSLGRRTSTISYGGRGASSAGRQMRDSPSVVLGRGGPRS